jgi:hypothetical protein
MQQSITWGQGLNGFTTTIDLPQLLARQHGCRDSTHRQIAFGQLDTINVRIDPQEENYATLWRVAAVKTRLQEA